MWHDFTHTRFYIYHTHIYVYVNVWQGDPSGTHPTEPCVTSGGGVWLIGQRRIREGTLFYPVLRNCSKLLV